MNCLSQGRTGLAFALLAIALLAAAGRSAAPPAESIRSQYAREPEVRIGVILEEDQADHVEMVLPREGPALFYVDGTQQPTAELPAGCSLRASVQKDRLTLQSLAPKRTWTARQSVRIEPLDPPGPLTPGQGILVKNLVAGRGFHWQKRMEQTLTGKLEIHHFNSQIVLVNTLPIEDYLTGVITAEMSSRCPIEFLKAQTVAARSWMLANPGSSHRGYPFQRCNDDHCQRYQGTEGLSASALKSVQETRGEVLLLPDGRICNANYSKSCGGIMARWSPSQVATVDGKVSVPDAPPGDPVWRFFPVTEDNLREYLTGDWLQATRAFCSSNVVDEETLPEFLGRVDEAGRYFRWRVTYTRQELETILRAKTAAKDLATLVALEPGARDYSGRLGRLTIRYLDNTGKEKSLDIQSQYRIRDALHSKFLFSSAFVIDGTNDAEGRMQSITFTGGGWGHGVGLCQIGALGMSLEGYRYDEILHHYYRPVTITRLYR